MSETRHILSLGAGVQSTTMALMAAAGEITPLPDAAVFADTQDEPKEVYAHLDWLKSVLPFPVIVGTAGKLSARLLEGDDKARMPFFIKNGGMARRQCTTNYKIKVIRREIRKLYGWYPRVHAPAGSVTVWVGISLDEADRMKPSGVKFMQNRWPLLEDGTLMSREDCKKWLLDHYGRSAPKSACKQCPYQETDRLRRLKESSPEEWEELCSFDASLRTPENVARFRGELFVHRSCEPLIQINLAAPPESKYKTLNLFTNECEGICGI